MKRLCLIFISLFIFGCKPLLAQTNLDSLWQVTFTLKDDTTKIKNLRVLSQQYQYISADTSTFLIKEALALAMHIGDQKQAYLCFRTGRNIFHEHAKLKLAKEWARKALALSFIVGKTIDPGEILSDMGLSCWRLGQLDSALYYFQESEQIFLQSGEKFWKVYANIGRLYKKKGDFENASLYLSKALNVVIKTDSRMDAGYVMYMLGELYLVHSDFENFDRIVDQWQAFKKAHPSKIQIGDRAMHIQSNMFFFENIQNKEKKLREGILYELKVGNYHRASNYLLTLGKILIEEDRLIEAKEVFLEGVAVQKKASYIQGRLETIYQLYEINKTLGEPGEALLWYEKHQTLSDSLQKEEMFKNMAELEVKYQTEKKEQALILKSLEARRAKLERNLLMAGSALLGLLAISFFYTYQKRTEVKRKLADHDAQIQRQKIEQLEQEQKVLSLNAMVEGQEQERQRIANDLHDSLGGLLTSVKLHFNSINKQIKDQKVYQKTDSLIDEACTEVRRIAHNMMPRALAFSGLSSALEDLMQDLEKRNIQNELEIVGLSPELPSTTSVMLYRIVQELFSNIIKHAEASHIFVQIFQNGDQLTLLVEDNGRGFDIGAARSKKGLGLSSIESRVRFLKGNIDWDSVVGEGMAVTITIPVEG